LVAFKGAGNLAVISVSGLVDTFSSVVFADSSGFEFSAGSEAGGDGVFIQGRKRSRSRARLKCGGRFRCADIGHFTDGSDRYSI
jgi:hypothetical protein